MPAGDGTGPAGAGPMTGRGAGYCAGYPVPGYMNPGAGFGWGRGFGRGRGWRNQYYATGLPGWARYGGAAYGPAAGYAPGYAPNYAAGYGPVMTQEQEIQALQAQAQHFETALSEINKRLEELQNTQNKENQ